MLCNFSSTVLANVLKQLWIKTKNVIYVMVNYLYDDVMKFL